MAMRRPRTARISAADASSSRCPSNTISPPAMRPGGDGTSCITDRLVTDLPDPDSPTIPSVSPRRTSKLTPSTARTTRPSSSK